MLIERKWIPPRTTISVISVVFDILLSLLMFARPVVSDSVMEAVVVRAGEVAILPCPGISDTSASGGYIVNHLVWSCPPRKTCASADSRGQLVEYTARKIHVHGDKQRVSMKAGEWALSISPASGKDSGSYSCSFNNQETFRRVAELVVLDVPSGPGKPMVTHHTSRKVQLSWAPSFQTNNSPIKHYLIQTRPGERGVWPDNTDGLRTPDTATNFTVTELRPFSVYTFRVIAVNAIGLSRPSPPSYPVSTLREKPAAAPKLVFAGNRSSTSVEVGWEPPPVHTLHGEFLGYKLGHRLADSGPLQPITVVNIRDKNEKSHVIEGLEPYTEYEVILQVRNPEDLGPSSSIKVRTGEGVPSRPRNVTLIGVSDRSLSITWLPPLRSNGVIRGYSIYSAAHGKTTRKLLVQGDIKRSITITKLAPDKEYRVWVKGMTSVGEGSRSAMLMAVTDVSGPGPPAITNVTCPSDVSIRLQWRRPQIYYRSVNMYFVLYRVEPETEFTERMVPVQSDGQSYAINLPNLTSSRVYEIRIQGATKSRLIRNKLYKGHRSPPTKVRMERGCEEIEVSSTWKPRPYTSLAATQIAAILLGLCVIVLLALTLLVWRRRRKRLPAPNGGAAKLAVRASAVGGWPGLSQEATLGRLFSQHVREMHAENDDGFRREWEMLQATVTRSAAANGADLIQKHNHLANGGELKANGTTTPAAHRLKRVAVKSKQFRDSGVPSAYFVDGFRTPAAYIVSEKPGTAEHDPLWQIIWEQDVREIVMVGGGTGQADRFWPEPGCVRQTGAKLMVEGGAQTTLANCVVRNFNVYKLKSQYRKSGRDRTVCMHQFTRWPEYGLPDSHLPLLQFVQRTLRRNSSPSSRHPLLVVSGTTYNSNSGIYISLTALLTQFQQNKELGVFSFWQHTICQCPYFLTTVQEYSFIHDCLLERVSAGETLVDRQLVHQYVESLQNGRRGSYPYPTAELQYKQAIALDTRFFTVISAAQPYNESKNRNPTHIPMESSRVRLTPKLSVEGSDYINASWLPGFYHSHEFVLTQHPLPNTVQDFWQMLWDHRLTTVACLTAEDCGIFWPLEEEELAGDNFVVRYLSASAGCSASYKSSWTIRSFIMESIEGENDVTVRVVFLPLWPEECSIDAVMESVIGVNEVHGDRHTPLVVMDRYAATEGASFCVLSSVLRQLQFEPLFDIFMYAKFYHQRRPGIWKTMREFLFLYQVLESWLPSAGDVKPALGTAVSCTSLCQNRSLPRGVTDHGHGVMV